MILINKFIVAIENIIRDTFGLVKKIIIMDTLNEYCVSVYVTVDCVYLKW